MTGLAHPRGRIWLALIVTPLLTPLAFFPIYAGYFMAAGYGRPGISWIGFLVFSYIFGLPLGYLAMGLLGWPWVAKLHQWNKLTVGYVCSGACAIGMIVFVAFAMLVGGNFQNMLEDILEDLAIGSVIGLVAGLIFCIMAGVPLRSRQLRRVEN